MINLKLNYLFLLSAGYFKYFFKTFSSTQYRIVYSEPQEFVHILRKYIGQFSSPFGLGDRNFGNLATPIYRRTVKKILFSLFLHSRAGTRSFFYFTETPRQEISKYLKIFSGFFKIIFCGILFVRIFHHVFSRKPHTIIILV